MHPGRLVVIRELTRATDRAQVGNRLLVLVPIAALAFAVEGTTLMSTVSDGRPPSAPRNAAPLTAWITSRQDAHGRSRHPADRLKLRQLIALGLPLYCGGPRGRDIALTFDDGPGVYSMLAIRVLERFHARATFFLVGRWIERYPNVPRKEAAIASFGDHTWTHRFLPGLSPALIKREIESAKALIERTTRRRVVLFRPPYAARSRTVDYQVRADGLLDVLWDVDSRDWVPGTTWKQIAATVISHLRPGSIIAMHENHGQTVEALRFLILPAIERLGFVPVTVPQLLKRDPPTLRQLRLGYAGCQTRGTVS